MGKFKDGMEYEEAVALVWEARHAYSVLVRPAWDARYADDLLVAAETLRDKAVEEEGLERMVDEALRAKGAILIPGRLGAKVGMLVAMVRGEVAESGSRASRVVIEEHQISPSLAFVPTDTKVEE